MATIRITDLRLRCIIGIFECIIIGWIFKASKLREHINHSGKIVLTKWWDVSIKFVVPAILLMLLIKD